MTSLLLKVFCRHGAWYLRRRTGALAILVAAYLGGNCIGQDRWGNWRGPDQTGASNTAKLPTEWSPETNVQWKVAIPGGGSSSPVVAGNTIYVTTAIKTDELAEGTDTSEPNRQGPPPGGGQSGRGGAGGRGGFGGMNNPAPTNLYEFVVMALDVESGKTLWSKVVNKVLPHEPGHSTNTYASGSPVTDGTRVFASFGSQGIYCLSTTGDVLWSRQLGKMTTRNQFGEGASPALHGDILVVPWDHDGYEDANGNGVRDDGELLSCVYGLDAKTGEVLWQTQRASEPTTWATPLIVETEDSTQVILNGTTVRSYDLATGKQLWACGGQVTNPIPSPVRFGDSVICMTGYRGNAIYSIPLSSRGDVTDSDTIDWRRTDAAPYVASPVLYDGWLYYNKSREGIIHAANAKTGEIVIDQTRVTELRDLYASPVAGDGKVYFTSRDGTTVVFSHGAPLKKLAVNNLGEGVDASPVILGNSLLIRTAGHLYRIAE